MKLYLQKKNNEVQGGEVRTTGGCGRRVQYSSQIEGLVSAGTLWCHVRERQKTEFSELVLDVCLKYTGIKFGFYSPMSRIFR